jgi:hypothetical protein
MKIVNPKKEIRIEIEKNDEIYFLNATPSFTPTMKNDFENNNSGFQKFLLQFQAADPYLYKYTEYVTFSTIEPLFSFPLQTNSVQFGNKLASLTKNVYNDSIFDSPLEIWITAEGGSVVNPYIINTTANKKIQITGTLADGEHRE